MTSTPASTHSGSSSVLSSLFGKYKGGRHNRRSSSPFIPGWDSDEDDPPVCTTGKPTRSQNSNPPYSYAQQGLEQGQQGQPYYQQEQPPFNEKSVWLAKEDRKQQRVRTCLCLGVILCFLVLGTILAFTFREQIFNKGAAGFPLPHPRKGGPGTGIGGGQGGEGAGDGKDTRQQLHNSIESIYHVNKTINKDSNLVNIFYGIDYTPHGSQEPDCRVNLGHVIEDIKVLSQLTNRIRLYGMACRQAEYVLKAIEYLGLAEMQVILTLWVDINKVSWEKQSRVFWSLIDNDLLIDASNSNDDGNVQAHKSIISISKVSSRIIGVSVGNEVLFRNEDENKKKEHVPLSLLNAYINDIRQGLAQRAAAASASSDPALNHRGQWLGQIPVFSSDLGRNAHQIVDQVDWVLSNIHPFFAYTSVENAADWAISNFREETIPAAAGKPAMISEVGWPSGPSSAKLGSAVPSMANLQTFVNTWVCRANKENIPYYFFEAFDEPWKRSINAREAQWGLMTVDRHLKVKIPTCQ
ncbi:hypothetical protein BGZ94_009367 [Podila epigama]|nr:hypothetical protein BGZ94_009367 [Podila epigama]